MALKSMNDNKIIIYYAIITKSFPECNITVGDTYKITPGELEDTMKHGYRIYKSDYEVEGANIYLPCKIVKKVYELISEDDYAASFNNEIKVSRCERERYEDPNEWMDHWC